MPTRAETTIDKLRTQVDADRLRSTAADLIVDLGGEQIRELAEKMTEMADAIDTATETVDEWRNTEDRDERAEAKDQALSAISDLCDLAEWGIGEIHVPEWLRAELIRGPIAEDV